MSNSAKRDRRIFLRTSAAESEALRHNAAAHHMNLSCFLREVGLTQTRWRSFTTLQQALSQATVVLHRLEQLHQLDPTEPLIQELIAQLIHLLAEIHTEVTLWSDDCQHHSH